MDVINELIDTLRNKLNNNKLINGNDLLSNELFVTLKIIDNCTSCKNKKNRRK